MEIGKEQVWKEASCLSSDFLLGFKVKERGIDHVWVRQLHVFATQGGHVPVALPGILPKVST